MRDKMKKTLGILLMTACLGTAFVGCGEGTLDYKGDALDGYVSEAEVQDLLRQGACGFLSKPHRIATVAKAIRSVLDGGIVTS